MNEAVVLTPPPLLMCAWCALPQLTTSAVPRVGLDWNNQWYHWDCGMRLLHALIEASKVVA